MMFDLPDYIEAAGGTRIPVNVDFRVWMELECALLAQDNHQLQDVLTRILPAEIPDIGMDRILPAVMGFYALRNPYPFSGIGGSAANKNRHERWYDFHVDSGRLAASFRAVYGIDLFRGRFLHWWEFRMLMFHLPPDCEFMRIVGYRLADISTLPKSQRKHYQKMKAMYALGGNSCITGTFGNSRTTGTFHGAGGFSSLEERDRDMLRRMEKIRQEMSENG